METDHERFLRYRKSLVGIIHKHIPACTIYLFGSRARGTAQPGADIDLALNCSVAVSFETMVQIYSDIEETTIPLTVDLVDLKTASDLMKSEVAKEGIVWEN